MTQRRTLEEEQQFFAEKGFGQRIGFGERPAVIVIDIQRVDPESMLGFNFEKEIEHINRVLDAARPRNIPVIFTVVAYDSDDFKDAGIWALKMKGISTLKAGTPAVELDPALHYQKGDMVITKKYASGFFGTDLVSRLLSQRVDTLIITGATTSGCVRATTVDALQYGFRPIVVREAVGDRSLAAHEQSLFDLQAKYADVLSTEEVVKYLRG